MTWGGSPALIHRTYYDRHRRRADVPTVVTVFDMIPEAFPANNAVIGNKRGAVQQADHIVCISQITAEDLVRLFGVAREKITVTYLGFSDVFQCPVL